MPSEPRTGEASAPPLSDRALFRAGAVLTLAAATLRLPASLVDPDASGTAIEILYYAIDISLLFAAITAFVAIDSSRTVLGTAGFAIAAIGAGLLIGPEPTDASVEYYTIGATAAAIGFAVLAVAWRRTPTITPATRRAFLASVAIGAAAGLHDAALTAAGIVFSLALLGLARDLHRIGMRAGLPLPSRRQLPDARPDDVAGRGR
jgi:hypothetical protein